MAAAHDPILEVVSPGLLTTVQDAGRPGLGHLGVPLGGAADGWSLAVANLLLDNPPGAAGLECTLVGPELLVLRDAVVATAGADLGVVVRPDGRRLAPGAVQALAAGDVLAFPGATADARARAYLAVPGGLDVPLVLGSRSTCLAAGFGGLDGRPLRAGDRLAPLGEAKSALAGRRWSPGPADPGASDPIRVLPGPGLEGLPDVGRARLAALCEATWAVDPASNRQGLRLAGSWPAGAPAMPDAGTGLSHGVVPGTIQLPPDGRPIVLLADAQPTGGYPVVGVAITADLPVLGQLVPGAAVRFEAVPPSVALEALAALRASLADGARRLREAGRWDALWRSAGG